MRAETAIYTAFEDFDLWDPAEPERNLMRAILRTALEDIKKSGEFYRDAKIFIINEDERYLFSFMSICHHLKLCPQTIRRVCGVGKRIEPQNLAA